MFGGIRQQLKQGKTLLQFGLLKGVGQALVGATMASRKQIVLLIEA